MLNDSTSPGAGNKKVPAIERVEAYLRTAIVSGKLLPWQRIVQELIAEKLAVSRGSVREALLRLERDGLVVMTPGEGAFVRGVAVSEIGPAFRIRAKLEGLCVRYMRENPSIFPQTLLTQPLENLANAAAKHDEDGFFRADLELHRTIWVAAGQPMLYRILNSLTNPYIFAIARFYSTRIPLSDRCGDHGHYVRLALETPLSGIEWEVEKYFEEVYHMVFEVNPWLHSFNYRDWTCQSYPDALDEFGISHSAG